MINNPQVTEKKEEYKRNAGYKVENPHKTEAYIQESTGIVPHQYRVMKWVANSHISIIGHEICLLYGKSAIILDTML